MFPRFSLAFAITAAGLLMIGDKAGAVPSDREYVVVDEQGHLSVNGRRQRYWAAIGKLMINADIKPEDSVEERRRKLERSRLGTKAILDHLERMGFNAVRMWYALGSSGDYEVGDGSNADCVDFFIAEAKKRGFRIWSAGVGNRTGQPSPDDAGIIDDPATEALWKEAIQATLDRERPLDLRHNIARAWDPRLEALIIERMRRNAQHLNKHTGLRWADDPVFAVWELTNEEWWMRKMVGGQWQRLPAFFRNQLIEKWNSYLREKYGSDQALASAWDGLLPGESLEKGSVIFAPMAGRTDAAVAMNDANEQALQALQALDSGYDRRDFSRARGADVLEFLMGVQLSHKERLKEAFKTFGKSTRLSPLLYDTGIGYEIQSQFLHQNAEAVAHDAYINGWGPPYQLPEMLAEPRFPHQNMLRQLEAERLSSNVGPWNNWLLKPPGIAQGVPWLEHNRVEGKPFLVYETQIQQPAKYRADFPLRLAALASIQDWCWVSWHYFAPHDNVGIEPNPFARPLDVTTGSHPQGYHYTYDEVQNAMMRAAAHIFRHQLLAPAPNPTTFIYGRHSLYDPDSMDYAGSYGKRGLDMLQTTYQYGVRIRIDPEREDDEVIGPVVSFDQRHDHNPYTPTDAITFDWKQGYLTFDAPAAVAFTGSIGRQGNRHRFANGVEIRDVAVHNPEGIFDPVAPEDNFIAFSLYSRDGLPLEKTRSAAVSLVSTSFNTGFRMGTDFQKGRSNIPAGTVAGGLPVLVARVSGVVECPAMDGMRYSLRDWNNNELGTGVVEHGRLEIRHELPVFSVELQR